MITIVPPGWRVMWAESMGEHSMIATDLLKALPEAFRRARDTALTPLVTIRG
jgi:hypothetical protein